VAEAFTSEWWLERLGKELDGRLARMAKLQQYYDGRQPLAYASERFRKSFGQTYAAFADNFCRLVVQAVEERLAVEGFRFGSDRRNARAWRVWQANQLDAHSQRAHREALIKSECSVIVAPPIGGEPIIRIQKPEEVAVAYDDDPLVRAVALKRWATPDGRTLATLYYADRIEKYQARKGSAGGTASWEPRLVDGEPWPLPHTLGAVPVVPLVNDPDIDGVGTSELAPVLPLQDGLNKVMVDMIVASEYSAFRQRWVTGLEIPIDPETQKPVELFKAAVDRVWMARDKDVKFGNFDESDLAPYVKAIETFIQHIATTTRTPPHYLLGSSGVFPSGESLRATETGLVAKARRRTRDFGESWEEVMRLAFRGIGDKGGAEFVAAETVWRDPEFRTESEHVDALLKLASLGVPNEQLWEDAGYTPQQIDRFRALRRGDDTAARLLAQAAQLHAAHMDGTEPTSPASQEKLMQLIESARNALRSPTSPLNTEVQAVR